MSEDQAPSQPAPEEDEAPALPRRPVRETADMDITPMIDIVFLLMIFFLVCSTASMRMAVDLPPARHGGGVSEQSSVIITVTEGKAGGPARVYLADGVKGKALDPGDTESIAAYIRKENKPNVLIKAEGKVKHGDVYQVESAADRSGGSKLHVAVMEAD
jgi:biopolymer transport protein ExbD